MPSAIPVLPHGAVAKEIVHWIGVAFRKAPLICVAAIAEELLRYAQPHTGTFFADLPLALANYILIWMLGAGIAVALFRLVRTGESRWRDLYAPFDRFGRLLALLMAFTGVSCLGFLLRMPFAVVARDFDLAWVGWIGEGVHFGVFLLISSLWGLSLYLMIDRNTKFGESLSLAYGMAWGERGRIAQAYGFLTIGIFFQASTKELPLPWKIGTEVFFDALSFIGTFYWIVIYERLRTRTDS